MIKDGLDDVIGVLYLKDVIKRVYDAPDSQTTERVESMMRKPSWCPDSKPVDQLLKEMQAKRVHLVVVVDEFGGTAGMVTIEDILEEIVGEITDEYDEENSDVSELADGRYRVSSRLPIDDLGDLFGLELDDEDVETVGGLMAKLLNKVPIAGSVVTYDGLELVAERATGRRNKIGSVIVSRIDDETDDRGVDAATRLASGREAQGIMTDVIEPTDPEDTQDHHVGPGGASPYAGRRGSRGARHRRSDVRGHERRPAEPAAVGGPGGGRDGGLLGRTRTGGGGGERLRDADRGRPGGDHRPRRPRPSSSG